MFRIKDVYKRLRGTPITATQMKQLQDPNGDVKIIAGGKTEIYANESDIPNANVTRVPAVLVQSRGIIDFQYLERPFTFKNEMWAYTASEKISVKYLYYYLKNNVKFFRDQASGMGSMPQISLGVTEDFVITMPSLSVQKKIVEILDSFDSICNSLMAGLPAEIEARKKQYEYYRDMLLSFGN